MEERRIVPPYATFCLPYNIIPSFNHYPIGYMAFSRIYIANPNPNNQAMHIPNPSNINHVHFAQNLVNPHQLLNPNQHLALHGYGAMPRTPRLRLDGPYARPTAQSQPILAPRVSNQLQITASSNTTETLNARNHLQTTVSTNEGFWTWTLDNHKRLVDAVSVFGGIDEARAESVWQYINDSRLSLYEVSTHMARLRVLLRNPQWLNAGQSVSNSAITSAADSATSSGEQELMPPTMPLLKMMENNAMNAGLFPTPEPDLDDNTLDSICELKLGFPGT